MYDAVALELICSKRAARFCDGEMTPVEISITTGIGSGL